MSVLEDMLYFQCDSKSSNTHIINLSYVNSPIAESKKLHQKENLHLMGRTLCLKVRTS